MHAAVLAPRTEQTSMSYTDVRVDELIVGRTLKFPVLDQGGVLLLAAGSLITSEFKRNLLQRKIGTIRASEMDSGRISLTRADFTDLNSKDMLSLDSEVASQLDKLIDSGLMVFQNHGQPVKSEAVYHGRKAYNLEKYETLRDQRIATLESLGSMMKETLHGRGVSSAVVNQLAASYLADMSDDADCVLAVAMEASQNASIADHCFKMSMLATAIAIEMGMNEDNCRRVCVAGLVHDWGMARVPEEVRNATRLLSQHDFFEIKKHPIHTAEILERIPGIPSMVPVIAYQVHERPNGRGYPRGRRGDRIHILARILAAADIFVALTERKSYRPPLAPYAAMECLVRMAKEQDVDPQVTRALLTSICLFPIGSLVVLNDGSTARVIRRNGDHFAKPIVQRVQDAEGNKVGPEDEHILDLLHSELHIVQALPTPGRDEVLLSEEILNPVRPRHA